MVDEVFHKRPFVSVVNVFFLETFTLRVLRPPKAAVMIGFLTFIKVSSRPANERSGYSGCSHGQQPRIVYWSLTSVDLCVLRAEHVSCNSKVRG